VNVHARPAHLPDAFEGAARIKYVPSTVPWKSCLPPQWAQCPLWATWCCEARAIVAVPEGIRWTAAFLAAFCAASGGCRLHEPALAAREPVV
jgi:hypothetical protein